MGAAGTYDGFGLAGLFASSLKESQAMPVLSTVEAQLSKGNIMKAAPEPRE